MRRGRDADPTPLEWLRDLLLAAGSLGLLLGLALAGASALALVLLALVDTVE